MAQMEQAVYVCVSNFMADVQVTRFAHLVRWQVGSIAYDHLSWSTAASSPSRAALVQLALRLLLVDQRRDVRMQDMLMAQLMRRLRRAVVATGIEVDDSDTELELVRRLARAYRVDRYVAVGVRRGRDAAQMRRIVDSSIREDVDSESDSESD